MKTPSPLNKPLVHFIGVGGIGISALAQWFLAQNWAISGSDIVESGLLQKLQKKGLKLKIGHKKTNISPKTALVIYNQAIPASNPEFKEAKRLGIPILSYPQTLGALTRDYKTIAVAGAHGKSTTTALFSLVLIKAGLDPTVIIGTKLKEFGDSNFRNGRSKWLIIEADEWKASFHNYSPAYAIITNIDAEHLDFYKNFANVKKSFLKFIGNIQRGGILVGNRDDKNLYSLKSKIQKIAKRRSFKVIWYSAIVDYSAHRKIKAVLKIPGEHNISNALAAYTLARALGVKEKTILQALFRYRGAWRRMEFRGELRIMNKEPGGRKKTNSFMIPVYDDYAHHPAEIKATLRAFREKFPNRKIICVFQPHQAHRTKNLFKEFISAFDLADYLILLPIYRVAGRDRPHKGYTSKDLAKAIKIRNSKFEIRNSVMYLPYTKRLAAQIRNLKLPARRSLGAGGEIRNSVIVMMGAGNIVNYTDLLLNRERNF